MSGLLDKERTVAGPGFNRWLVPPAALAIHLSIGMAYGFSVFWLPLSRAIGITQAAPGDWKISTLGWMFTLFFVFLGSSAAVFGRWLERNGPRKAGVAAAFCWGGGFFISALGVHLHQIALLWLGSGVIGGCGLGLGYISPVSTLIKWFPDKRGMATGMAIMGFGGGAMIGAPLADRLMKLYATPTSVGVWETFLTMGAIYFVAMLAGAFVYRIPPPDWKPHGWTPPAKKAGGMITHGHVHVDAVHKTPQFWLLWAVLCLNVSAGIGVIGMASPMLQEVFGGKLIGLSGCSRRSPIADKLRGRHDRGRLRRAAEPLQHRRPHLLGLALRLHRPQADLHHLLRPRRRRSTPRRRSPGGIRASALFVALFCLILTMYGGGFATIPAYLADLFGTQFVGRHPRPSADGLVDGRRPGTGAGQLHPRIPAQPRRAHRVRLQHDPVHPGRPAGPRLPGQSPGPAGRGQRHFMTRGGAGKGATDGPRQGGRRGRGRRSVSGLAPEPFVLGRGGRGLDGHRPAARLGHPEDGGEGGGPLQIGGGIRPRRENRS